VAAPLVLLDGYRGPEDETRVEQPGECVRHVVKRSGLVMSLAICEPQAARCRLYRGGRRINRPWAPSEKIDWASEIAWRLIRSYELRFNGAESRLEGDIDGLLPRQDDDSSERARLREPGRGRRRESGPVERVLSGPARRVDRQPYHQATTDS